MTRTGRLLVLAGAVALVVGALLPWVRVEGVPLKLDFLDVRVPLAGRRVAGTDTAAWPVLVVVAAVVALLAALGRGRRVLIGLGLLAVAGSAGLLYYLANVIEIETSDRSELEQTLAAVAIQSSVQIGPYVLLVGAVLILAGALMPEAQQGRR